jgi:hypothetical protein
MDDLFLEDLGEKIGLQNKTMKIRGAFSSLIWKDHLQSQHDHHGFFAAPPLYTHPLMNRHSISALNHEISEQSSFF